MKEQPPECCNIHGLGLIRIVRKVVAVEQYNKSTKEYEPLPKPLPTRFDLTEYLCPLCDNV